MVAHDSLPKIKTWYTPLRQVLQNLIGNSIKHSEGEHGQVDLSAIVAGGVCEFTVQDNGVGIEPKYQEQIFEMFATLQSRDRREGSGMGLAIVRKIVQRYGGRIWVNSQPNEGSAFSFTWPLDPETKE